MTSDVPSRRSPTCLHHLFRLAISHATRYLAMSILASRKYASHAAFRLDRVVYSRCYMRLVL